MKRCRHCDRAPYHCGRCILERFEAAIEALDAREAAKAIRLEKRKKSDFKYRTRPENQERRRAYNREYQRQRRQNPEVREREKRQQLEYSQRPEAREVRRAYRQRPEVRERENRQQRERNARKRMEAQQEQSAA